MSLYKDWTFKLVLALTGKFLPTAFAKKFDVKKGDGIKKTPGKGSAVEDIFQ